MTHRRLRDFAKAPDAELDYGINWGEKWLEGDTLDTSEWAILSPNPGDGLSIADEAHTDSTTTVWLSGGVLGKQYLLRNSITTTGGRSDSRVIAVTIRER